MFLEGEVVKKLQKEMECPFLVTVHGIPEERGKIFNRQNVN